MDVYPLNESHLSISGDIERCCLQGLNYLYTFEAPLWGWPELGI